MPSTDTTNGCMKCRLFSILFRVFLVLYIGVVAYLCFANFKDLPDIQKTILGIPADKVVHFCMFFPLPIIGFMAFGSDRKKLLPVLVAIINICAFSCIFAGITEIIQGSLPYRSEDITDFCADCLSICISGLLTFIVACLPRKKRRARS